MESRIPSLNWLRVFEAAARTESFARAAQQLNMSAAAVSQQVRALEDRLGAPLFTRHAQAVRVTEAGRAYLPPVQQALMTLEEATEGLFGAVGGQGLYLQSVLIFAHGILTKGLAEFEAQHPGISVMLSTGNSASDFQQGFSDLKIIFGNPHERPGAGRMVHADNTLMAMAMSRAGRGIALARTPASDLEMQGAGLVPCLPGFEVQGSQAYHLVYDSLSGLRPPARRFRDWLLDWVRAQGWA